MGLNFPAIFSSGNLAWGVFFLRIKETPSLTKSDMLREEDREALFRASYCHSSSWIWVFIMPLLWHKVMACQLPKDSLHFELKNHKFLLS
jgi:hypothetical protein